MAILDITQISHPVTYIYIYNIHIHIVYYIPYNIDQMRKDIVWNPQIVVNQKTHQPEMEIEDYIIHNTCTCSLLMIVDICSR